MKKSKAAKIIERVAIQEKKSVAEVRADMQEAINIAYENHDESSESFWGRFRGIPNPDEFLGVASKEVLERLNFEKKT
jgi:hypothetical protein